MRHPCSESTEAPSSPEPHIAILVVGCLLPHYDKWTRAIRSTWGSRPGSRIDIFYVYGGQSLNPVGDVIPIEDLIGQPRPPLRDHEVWVSGDIILCGAADLNIEQPDCILRKRLIAFGYLADQGRYDFVYTVCACSYVDVDVLRQYVAELPVDRVYQGPLSLHYPGPVPFVSGASMLLSRDLVADLSSRSQSIIAANTAGDPDDVVIGRWVVENRCEEPVEEVCQRLSAGQAGTRGQAFVVPNGRGLTDFVMSPPADQVPQEHVYHYHFNSQDAGQMEEFHRRYFGADVRGGRT